MDTSADTFAVTHLITRYAELVDTGDFAGVGALFAKASFIGSGPPVEGAEAVERMLRESVILYEDGTPRTHHVTTNIAVDIDDDAGRASARSYVTVFQELPGLPLQPVAAGRYRDRFYRHYGQWRFVERQVTMHLVGDVSRHLRG
ncbi:MULTISPECIES: nuclear transport factor 2 family protein [unclassified Streptomyces]|uniref:nuclear transport factor 2 family protein n=1 Tax=unclassified Streptomyces TaxID=2593676 RepID=UPI000DB9F81B|nr:MULTISPECIES: nuclear transport factor 2 family protein [unclassified Streptomyces]MYT71801.1 nuclear transport factor 2 family protein [Streptomyces sp. SID8367]RAJ72635.1 3-phenylpropionate/cinnamic acid dioxygenase small subunit [Streptomyces sp. PsTaAH-137]